MLVKNGRVSGFELALIPNCAFDVLVREGAQTLVGKNKMLGARVHRPVDQKTAAVDIDATLVDYRVHVRDLQVFGARVEKLALRAQDVCLSFFDSRMKLLTQFYF
jgi:hypothetical protein